MIGAIRARYVLIGCLALLASVLAPSAMASSDLSAQAALAARYAPVIRLPDQPRDCGPGEPYVPINVNVLFNNPAVALRGPWSGANLVKVAPAAGDLTGTQYEYHLDFPGDALNPGCTYLDWSRLLNEGQTPTVYAHVATDSEFPGQIALQYWMFYVFNDWNNLHEGDWEMIQLNFRAANATQALHATPTEVGYSQHEGAEGATWGDPKLQIVDGTHPVVYPGAGSHANFYSEALYLGASGSAGVGCDDTRNANLLINPTVVTIPSDPAAAATAFPWITFAGRWGEEQPAFFNGPTGPNLKPQWTHPIAWSQDWRDRAYAVPTTGALGTATTTFFCGAMTHGSRLLWRLASNPFPTVVGFIAVMLLIVFALSRATWRPATALRVGRRRAWGQILSAAWRMYFSRFRLFVGIGLLMLPIAVVITILQTVVLRATSLFGVESVGTAAGAFALLVFVLGTALTLLALALVQAATARALMEIDNGRTLGPVRAYRLVVGTIRPLLGALVVSVLVVSVLGVSFYLLPIAIWLAIRWALIVPVIEVEGVRALPALRRSGRLVRRGWLKVASLTIAAAGLVLVSGPLIGSLLIFATGWPLPLLNLVAGVVYVVAMPFVALTTMYVYFDTRVRDERQRESAPVELPAQIEVSPGH
jgi:hypothetical protein